MKKTVCIVHYNTPELTAATVRSLNKHTQDCRIVVFDNSDTKPFIIPDGFNRFVEVIDNTKGQIIGFDVYLSQFPDKETGAINKSNYGSAKHCMSVQWLIEHLEEPFVLMDSDILVRRDISELCNPRYAFVGHIVCNTRQRFGLEIYRVEPFLCYINTPKIKVNGVTYFNSNYMWALSHKTPNNRYDTGAWFFKDCCQHNLPYLNVNITPYMIHLGHGSWIDGSAEEWLKKNKELYT